MPKTRLPTPSPSKTRQQKLAEKLRENLKRRKAQTRRRNLVQSDEGATKPETGGSEKAAKPETK